MNKNIMNQLFPEEMKLIEEQKCPICTNFVNEDEFRNVLSKQDYKITGLCQICQDRIYG